MRDTTIITSDTYDGRCWLLFSYALPAQHAHTALAVSRLLRRVGALRLQAGLHLLPMTDDHFQRVKRLEGGIKDAKGDVLILRTTALDRESGDLLLARFKAERSHEYQNFLGKCIDLEEQVSEEYRSMHLSYPELEKRERDLRRLRIWFERLKSADAYWVTDGSQAEHTLRQCEAHIARYASRVLEAHIAGG